MDNNSKKILSAFSPGKIIIPVAVGLGVIIFLLLTNDEINLDKIVSHIGQANLGWISAAFLVLVLRDLGYIYRIRHLTNGELNWLAGFFVIVLWELASAITPSVVGGTTIVVFVINKEGIPLGRSLAYVMLTAVLDNMFFVLASLLIFLLVPTEQIFPEFTGISNFSTAFPLRTAFFLSVSLIALYTLLMFAGLFLNPRAFKYFLIKITGNRLFRRFRSAAVRTGEDVIVASRILRKKKLKYWLKAVFSTIFIWISRYFMLNCLIAAFVSVHFSGHLLILARQVIMWVVMLVSPTPGSTGAAEYAFNLFFSDFFEVMGLTVVVALFWRLLTYYAYLILGMAFLPRWIRRTFYAKTGDVAG